MRGLEFLRIFLPLGSRQSPFVFSAGIIQEYTASETSFKVWSIWHCWKIFWTGCIAYLWHQQSIHYYKAQKSSTRSCFMPV